MQKAKTSGIKNNQFINIFTISIFTISLFLSASLMFAVQPMVGKMLLPVTGGTPASWIVTMAFFQISLLVGYMLAWAMSKFGVRTHTLMLTVLLGIGYFVLPVKIVEYSYILDNRGIEPISIFILLCFAIGLPFTAISTVSSTLQRLFTATDHKHAHDPYFLYAASNAGSLIGLLSYPILIEPILTVSEQTIYWQYLYGSLIFLCLFCLILTFRIKDNCRFEKEDFKEEENINWQRRLEWLLLAFFPSSLLMGTTTYIITDVISVPLLWVVPLGLYLITHILAFSKRKFFDKKDIYKLHLIITPLIILFLIDNKAVRELSISAVGFIAFILCFFIIALALHTRLASLRPNSKYLTEFYFFLALGGALGGSFNAFLAPVIFNSVIEFPLMILFASFVNPFFKTKLNLNKTNFKFFFVGICFLLVYLLTMKLGIFSDMVKFNILLISVAFLLVIDIKPALFVVVFIYIFNIFVSFNGSIIHKSRNFFGVSKVQDVEYNISEDKKLNVRYFTHGTTIHGIQNLTEDVKTSPITSYYSPLREIVDTYKPKHIGLLGLGAGVIRCYSAPDRYFTMYEIDEDVVAIAKKYFDFLKECGSPKDEIIVGDGRLEMEKRQNDKYDLIIMDAFTSDNVPAHLLTKEAMQIYKDRLNDDGLIAVHVSNRYLNLKRAIIPTANTAGLYALHNFFKSDKKDPLIFNSEWIILAKSEEILTKLQNKGWKKKKLDKNIVWTDEYTSIMSVFRMHK